MVYCILYLIFIGLTSFNLYSSLLLYLVEFTAYLLLSIETKNHTPPMLLHILCVEYSVIMLSTLVCSKWSSLPRRDSFHIKDKMPVLNCPLFGSFTV